MGVLFMGSERRRYVRVSDIVSLRYKVISEEEVEEQRVVGPHFSAQLLQLDNQLQLLLPRLRERSSDMADVIELLNQKIMVVSEQLSEQLSQQVGEAQYRRDSDCARGESQCLWCCVSCPRKSEC
jgi:transcriptional regulator of aromatic amino acid metabolism